MSTKLSRFAHGSALNMKGGLNLEVELDSCENSNSRCFHLQGVEPVFVAFKGFLDILNRCAYPKTSM